MEKTVYEKCPRCGGEEYYIKVYMKGMVPMHYDFKTNKPVTKESMYDNLFELYRCNYIYCSSCHKRLKKIEELDLNER